MLTLTVGLCILVTQRERRENRLRKTRTGTLTTESCGILICGMLKLTASWDMFVYWEILLNLHKEIWQNHSSWGIVIAVSKQSKGWWNNAVKDLYVSSASFTKPFFGTSLILYAYLKYTLLRKKKRPLIYAIYEIFQKVKEPLTESFWMTAYLSCMCKKEYTFLH